MGTQAAFDRLRAGIGYILGWHRSGRKVHDLRAVANDGLAIGIAFVSYVYSGSFSRRSPRPARIPEPTDNRGRYFPGANRELSFS